MIKLIVGTKGSGKTKAMIDRSTTRSRPPKAMLLLWKRA